VSQDEAVESFPVAPALQTFDGMNSFVSVYHCCKRTMMKMQKPAGHSEVLPGAYVWKSDPTSVLQMIKIPHQPE
jgi:hypothetical protein